MYIKDLRVFKNRSKKKMLVVDNSCFSFCKNLNNGLPIIPYYDDKSDIELRSLQTFIMKYLY